jgi:hypothetical protein
MATVYPVRLLPESAQFLASAFPSLGKANGTSFPVMGLYYDAATDEAAFWHLPDLSDYGSGNWSVDIEWYASNATSGNVVWEVQIASITPNTDSGSVETKALGTLNFVQDTHLGTTGKRLHRCTITLSNLDSFAVLDDVWLRIARDANSTNATDDMANDAILTAAIISYSDT